MEHTCSEDNEACEACIEFWRARFEHARARNAALAQANDLHVRQRNESDLKLYKQSTRLAALERVAKAAQGADSLLAALSRCGILDAAAAEINPRTINQVVDDLRTALDSQ